jgi:hypothetical protein
MKYIISVFSFLVIFSCVTVTNGENKSVDNISVITGRVEVFGNEPHTYVGIVDINDIQYAVYPRSKEDELRRLQGRMIEFSVEFVDVQTYGSMFLRGGTVTPISWVIIR